MPGTPAPYAPSAYVAELAEEHSAHIVLCDAAKAPCWLESGPYSWTRRRPSSDVIRAHRGPFGVIPWSLKTTGLDVDYGDPLRLCQLLDPIATLKTRRGHHLYAPDTEPRKQGTFELEGCRGDVRSADGYLVLHYDGAERLLDAVRRRDDWEPRDLFALVGLPAVTAAPVARRAAVRKTRRSPAFMQTTVTIAEAVEGTRWKALLRYLGDLAHVQNRPRRWPGGPVDLDAWHADIRGLAVDALEIMPRPRLPEREVRRIAYLVSSWYASGGRRDHSPATQAWRGKASGKARYEDSNEQRRPWEAEGVSRRTWYRHRARQCGT